MPREGFGPLTSTLPSPPQNGMTKSAATALGSRGQEQMAQEMSFSAGFSPPLSAPISSMKSNSGDVDVGALLQRMESLEQTLFERMRRLDELELQPSQGPNRSQASNLSVDLADEFEERLLTVEEAHKQLEVETKIADKEIEVALKMGIMEMSEDLDRRLHRHSAAVSAALSDTSSRLDNESRTRSDLENKMRAILEQFDAVKSKQEANGLSPQVWQDVDARVQTTLRQVAQPVVHEAIEQLSKDKNESINQALETVESLRADISQLENRTMDRMDEVTARIEKSWDSLEALLSSNRNLNGEVAALKAAFFHFAHHHTHDSAGSSRVPPMNEAEITAASSGAGNVSPKSFAHSVESLLLPPTRPPPSLHRSGSASSGAVVPETLGLLAPSQSGGPPSLITYVLSSPQIHAPQPVLPQQQQQQRKQLSFSAPDSPSPLELPDLPRQEAAGQEGGDDIDDDDAAGVAIPDGTSTIGDDDGPQRRADKEFLIIPDDKMQIEKESKFLFSSIFEPGFERITSALLRSAHAASNSLPTNLCRPSPFAHVSQRSVPDPEVSIASLSVLQSEMRVNPPPTVSLGGGEPNSAFASSTIGFPSELLRSLPSITPEMLASTPSQPSTPAQLAARQQQQQQQQQPQSLSPGQQGNNSSSASGSGSGSAPEFSPSYFPPPPLSVPLSSLSSSGSPPTRPSPSLSSSSSSPDEKQKQRPQSGSSASSPSLMRSLSPSNRIITKSNNGAGSSGGGGNASSPSPASMAGLRSAIRSPPPSRPSAPAPSSFPQNGSSSSQQQLSAKSVPPPGLFNQLGKNRAGDNGGGENSSPPKIVKNQPKELFSVKYDTQTGDRPVIQVKLNTAKFSPPPRK